MIKRDLTKGEREATLALLREVASDHARVELMEDLEHSIVEDRLPDRSLLAFCIAGHEPSRYRGQDVLRRTDGSPIEGVVVDADGAEIDILLYVASGRLHELELVKHTGTPVLAPDWSSFRVKYP